MYKITSHTNRWYAGASKQLVHWINAIQKNNINIVEGPDRGIETANVTQIFKYFKNASLCFFKQVLMRTYIFRIQKSNGVRLQFEPATSGSKVDVPPTRPTRRRQFQFINNVFTWIFTVSKSRGKFAIMYKNHSSIDYTSCSLCYNKAYSSAKQLKFVTRKIN